MDRTAFRIAATRHNPTALKVVDAFHAAIPGAHIEIEGGDRLSVFVISPHFQGMPTWRRMIGLWNILRGALAGPEQERIAVATGLAPEELPALQRSSPLHRHIGRDYRPQERADG